MPGLQRKYPLGHPRDDDTPPEPRSGLRQQSRRPQQLLPERGEPRHHASWRAGWDSSYKLQRRSEPPYSPEGTAGRRYVAHVFYAFNNRGIEQTFLKGRYLNQELVDKGFAKVV